MDLWIRSQDKKKLLKATSFGLDNDETSIFANNYDGDYVNAGKYATKERALEVLDEIQKKIHQTFICELKPLLTRADCIKLKSDLEGEYPNNEFIMQPPHYELKPINSNVVIYEMPKE